MSNQNKETSLGKMISELIYSDPEVLKKDLQNIKKELEEQGNPSTSPSVKVLNEVIKTSSMVSRIEKNIASRDKKYVFIGQIGSGKSSIVSSLLPSIILTPGENIDDYNYREALKKYNSKQKEYEEKNGKENEKLKAPERSSFVISPSKRIERSSLLHTGKGRTTLAKTTVILDPDAPEMYVSFSAMSFDESMQYVSEYLDYLWTEKEEKHKAYFPEELARYIRNSCFVPLLKQQLDIEVNREVVSDFISDYIERDDRRGLESIIHHAFMGRKTKLSLAYKESTFEKAFPSLYKKVKNESETNLRLRFFKMIMKHINAGNLGNLLIPKSVTITMPEGVNGEKITLVDTKGTEKSSNGQQTQGTYLNRDIDELMKDERSNAVFISRFEDAPSPDIIEILTESSVAASIKQRSAVLVSVKDHSISGTEIGEKKFQCDSILPVMKGKFYFYDAYLGMAEKFPSLSDSNLGIYDLLDEIDKERIATLEKERNDLLTEISLRMDWFRNVFTKEEGKKVLSVLNRIDTMKDTSVKEKARNKKYIESALANAIFNTHHSIVNASMRRSGVYHNLDLPSVMSIKVQSFIHDVFDEIDEYISSGDSIVDLPEEKRRVFHAAFDSFERDEKEVILSLCQKALDKVFLDPSFWDEAVEQWGKGPGYRKRIFGLFIEKGDLRRIDVTIPEKMSAIIFKDVLNSLNVLSLGDDQNRKKGKKNGK